MKKIRMGIIGFGAQGSAYTKFIIEGKIPNMVLGAVCEILLERKIKFSNEYPDIPVYSNYKDIIKSGKVDAIATCVPHYLHPEISIEALKNDINVLCEKPVGVYTKQVIELNKLAKRKKNTTFAVMFNQRVNPLFIKVREIIKAHKIGELRNINWIITNWWRPQIYYAQSKWRATWGGEGGGVLVNQAPHQLDLLQWLCGKPEKIYSIVKYGYQRDINVEDDVVALMEYKNGATCTHDILGTDRLEIVVKL
jgi:predicted dehydrogenase